jgi:hypothetical protein
MRVSRPALRYDSFFANAYFFSPKYSGDVQVCTVAKDETFFEVFVSYMAYCTTIFSFSVTLFHLRHRKNSKFWN